MIIIRKKIRYNQILRKFFIKTITRIEDDEQRLFSEQQIANGNYKKFLMLLAHCVIMEDGIDYKRSYNHHISELSNSLSKDIYTKIAKEKGDSRKLLAFFKKLYTMDPGAKNTILKKINEEYDDFQKVYRTLPRPKLNIPIDNNLIDRYEPFLLEILKANNKPQAEKIATAFFPLNMHDGK